MIASEINGGLPEAIGSTGSGTGAAVMQRIQRTGKALLAKDVPELKEYIRDVKTFLRQELDQDKRVIIEGTQGYGLSLLHTAHYPKATSRDTTAAGFLAEVGLSPLDVDDVVLTIRAFPIRVSGDSGPLPNEITWEVVTKESGSSVPICETTSVTKKIRRVARFDCGVVRNAIISNKPTRIVLNHLDQVDVSSTPQYFTQKVSSFVEHVELEIGSKIDYVGLNAELLVSRKFI
jgi:adenylosuccinate synthase